jgi:hypothetical protein
VSAASKPGSVRHTVDTAETRQWIEDWRADMFSSTSRDEHGWPIEMHGLVMDIETLLDEREAFFEHLPGVLVTVIDRMHQAWLDGKRPDAESIQAELKEALSGL